MKKLLAEIRDGSFAKAWIEENEKGCPISWPSAKPNSRAPRATGTETALDDALPQSRTCRPGMSESAAPPKNR